MKNFRGWKNVFSFNYKQNAGSKAYIAVTTLVALAIIAVSILVCVLTAKPEDGKEGNVTEFFCDVEKVYVLDNAGLGELKFANWIPELKENYYSNLELEQVNGMTTEELQTMAAQDESRCAIGVVIEKEGNIISVTAIVPSTSEDLSLSDGKEMAELVAIAVEKARALNSGMDEFEISQVKKQTMISVSEAGEEEDIIAMLIKMFAPMVFGLLLYSLLVLYGQNISQSVSVEKTSKLMETLLTSLHPYALLAGKVFAIVAVALQQFFIWVAALVIGIIAGGKVAELVYPGAEGGLGAVIEFLRANIGETAFSPATIVLALVTFCCGFLFYCVLFGMAGSMVNRPEEAASILSLFQLPIIISFFVTYFGSLMGKEAMLAVARNIPFTIPFGVPVDLLTGTISIGQGILSTVILLVFSVLVVMLSGRIYKGLVLYNGEKVTAKNIIGILKNKN